MKTKILTSISALLVMASSLTAATITFSNTDPTFAASLAPIVDSNGTAVAAGTGSVAIGYFTDEAGVALGDFSSFNLFGTATTVNGAGFGLAGMYSEVTSEAILAGSSFIGQNIFTFVQAGGESLVVKSATAFAQDAPLFSATINAAESLSVLYGAVGPIVDIGTGPTTSLQLAVPEPSAYAALAGFLALGCVALRRRK